jgi:hypothetical protein
VNDPDYSFLGQDDFININVVQLAIRGQYIGQVEFSGIGNSKWGEGRILGGSIWNGL